MTNVNDENTNSNNGSSELTEEQKKVQLEQEEADRKEAETGTIEELREQNKRLFERAKSAEDEKRKLKAERDVALSNQNNKSTISKSTDNVSAEELRLIARGLSDEEIDQAKIISKGRGISLPEALKDPMFVSYQKEKKEEEKKAKAKLGASKGSGQAEEENTFREGMTPEEHKAAWLKQQGN